MSEMVQDRGVWPIEWHYCQCDLECGCRSLLLF